MSEIVLFHKETYNCIECIYCVNATFSKEKKKIQYGELLGLRADCKMSLCMTKPTKWPVRPAKTQIILGIRPVWSESLLYALWVAKDPNLLQADSEDSDQTRPMPRLICIFTGCKGHSVFFCRAAAQMFLHNSIYLFAYHVLSLINKWCWRADWEILIHDGEAGINEFSHLPDNTMC